MKEGLKLLDSIRESMHAIEEDHLLEFLKDRGVETNLETVAVEPEKALHAVHVSAMSLRECCVSEPDVLDTIKLRAELIGPVTETSRGGSHLPYTKCILKLIYYTISCILNKSEISDIVGSHLLSLMTLI